MEIWVKDIKTNNSWKLDGDTTKLVYEKDGHPVFKLADIGRFRFYPVDPNSAEVIEKERCHELEMDSEGYQFSLFDFMEGCNE